MKNPPSDPDAYTPEQRAVMILKMKLASGTYYRDAVGTGVHAFIEFNGLMNEFIQVCERAQSAGQDFTMANTHSGQALPVHPHNLTYLAEKLNCIYGPALLGNEDNRRAFVEELFEGEYELVRKKTRR
jgi:hypothetical protein